MTTLAELILRADYRQVDEASGSLGNLTQAGGKAASAMKSLAVTLGAAFGVREVMQAAEAYTTISNRLSLVTKSSDELYAAQSDLFEIAQRTRSPLEATAEVYQRLAQNAGALGLSLSEVGDTTETINKLMVISGTSAQSAEAALTQLGQAFASGTLRGEELNSVMEQAPALAMAIAEGMGVTVGELRKLGEQGKITSLAVVDALKLQSDAVDKQFAQMAKTLGDAKTTIVNSFINIVGQMDRVTGASSAIADSIVSLSKAMDDNVFREFTLLTESWGGTFRAVNSELGKMDDVAGGVAAAIGAVVAAGWKTFVDMPNNIRTSIQLLTIEITDFVAKGVSGFQTLKEASKAIFTSDTISGALARGDARYKAYEDAYQASTAAILAENANIKAQGEFLARRAELEKLLDGTGILDTKQGSGKAPPAAGAGDKKKNAVDPREVETNTINIQLQMEAEANRQVMMQEMEDAANAQKLMRLQEQFASEAELENLEYQRKLDDYATYAEMENIAKESQIAYKEQMAKDHENRLRGIAEDAAKKDKTTLTNKLGAAKTYMESLYAATGAHSNKMTKLIQTVGATQAFLNTFIAASQTLRDQTLPWWAKAAAVASTIATGMGLVNAIKGGGGSGGGGGGGGVASTPDASGITSSQQQPVRASVVDIRIQSRGLWRDEDVAELMEAMGERLVDGARFGRVEFVRQ